MQPGDLVGLIDRHGPRLALVTAVQGSRAQILVGSEARGHQVPLRQLDRLCPLPRGLEPVRSLQAAPWSITPSALARATPRRRDWAAAWLLLKESGDCLPLQDFTALVTVEESAVAMAACWLALQQPGQDLFRWRQGQVQARQPDDLRSLRHGRRRQQLLEHRQWLWHTALRQRAPIDPDSLLPAHRLELELLQAWASGDQDQPLPEDLQRALQQARVAPEPGALRHLLVDLGQWELHGLPSLRHSLWAQPFPQELLDEASRLASQWQEPRPGDDGRRDFTGMRAFTIDDPGTQEIDDALSLERLNGDRLRLWIHIADPGRLVEEGSPLDREARRRASSLYLAGGSVPMFPIELAAGPFSLRQGVRCAAWSYGVELGDDGRVEGSELCRSWLRPTYRLSYEDGDELIELAPPEDPDLAVLHGLLERRRRWRERSGALLMEQSEGRIRRQDDEPVLEVVEPSPARLMVAEAMILAGAVVAAYGSREGLALPYRSQPASELPSPAELDQLEPGPVRHAALRRGLSRGITSPRPAPHFSLGLEAYVQATSPIRRYGDLLLQRQLAVHQAGGDPLDAEGLAELLDPLEAAQRQAVQIAREDQRHWQQVWFERHRSERWQALFLRWLRPQDGLALVHVEALAMDVAATAPDGCQPGDPLQIQVAEVDPLSDRLRLRAVRSGREP